MLVGILQLISLPLVACPACSRLVLITSPTATTSATAVDASLLPFMSAILQSAGDCTVAAVALNIDWVAWQVVGSLPTTSTDAGADAIVG